jgi:predicted lipoprotein with Yx(FWY)xxD motif
MTHIRSTSLFVGADALLITVLSLAACGNGNDEGSGSAARPKQPDGETATIGVANRGLGEILVDSQGRTLYLFKKDSGLRSSCFRECARDWPPLRTGGKPTVGSGVKASLVATTARADGQPEVTYNGHPVNLFEGDDKAGDTNGQGLIAFGGEWLALSPTGDEVSKQSSSSGGNGAY